MLFKIPILKVGSKDENGQIHTLESLKKLEKEYEECEIEDGILYFKKEIIKILGKEIGE